MTLESLKDFKNTPKGKYEYWSEEIKASQKMLEKWHKAGDKIVTKFLSENNDSNDFRLNLFHSTVTTTGSMLYGNTPKIDVSRRYAQATDDVGRVAAEMMERLLNLDVEENGAEIDAVLRSTLQDRLLPGLGCARVRYDLQTEMQDVPDPQGILPPTQQEVIISETAPIDYYFWGDVLWGWARNWADVPWVAFRNYLTKDEIAEKFGKQAAEGIELKKQKMQTGDENYDSDSNDSAWMKGEIWEVWCKRTRTVHWLSIGYTKQLKEQSDPLQLQGFFPVPPFFIANVTTSMYKPKADFTLHQDLYNELDRLQSRISTLTEAVKAVGVYDASADGVQRMFKEGVDNDLIPVDNWALFGEKGGLKGVVDWVPIGDIVEALDKLRSLRDETIGLLQQVTGMADVMRGNLGNQYEGVGQSQIKAKFGSIRIQALQDEFAQFAGDLMQLKAEVISRHFDPQTIFKQANMQASPDKELASEAINLIKQPEVARLRVKIRPESVAMTDFAQLKNERVEYLTAISNFMQSAKPLMEEDPKMKPFLLQLMSWGLAGFKGSSEIEGVVDRAIEEGQKAAQGPEKPDPALQMEQMKAQVKLKEIQAKAMADQQLREQDKQADIQTANASHQMKMMEIQAANQAKLAEISAKMEADALLERIQSEINLRQAVGTARAESQKDQIAAQLDVETEAAKTALKIKEISATSAAKIQETADKTTTGAPDE